MMNKVFIFSFIGVLLGIGILFLIGNQISGITMGITGRVVDDKCGGADFDRDGDVDGNDFFIWNSNHPIESGASQIQGDADGDGDVDGRDYLSWQDNFPSENCGLELTGTSFCVDSDENEYPWRRSRTRGLAIWYYDGCDNNNEVGCSFSTTLTDFCDHQGGGERDDVLFESTCDGDLPSFEMKRCWRGCGQGRCN